MTKDLRLTLCFNYITQRCALNRFSAIVLAVFSLSIGSSSYAGTKAQEDLYAEYLTRCETWSDISEHVPVLRELSKECSTVTEIGVRSMNSTFGILQGLSENGGRYKSYTGIDLSYPPMEIYHTARNLAYANGIDFRFITENDMKIDISPTDMLFIDSLHTYCHLTYELEKFCDKVSRYITLHDTSAPWGESDDSEYWGDHSEYPAFIDRTKKGLWPAVVDFLERHPEWVLQERKTNSHGFTILRRVD